MPEAIQGEEVRLETEKNLKYRGTARVQLQHLQFRWDGVGEPSIKNVEKLKETLKKDCRRLETRNHVPAIVSQADLDNALAISGLSCESLLSRAASDYPDLLFPSGYRLECLHGKRRILAAKEVLSFPDRWWTVDFYLTDIDTTAKLCLIEEYSNEKRPSAGEIYRKIRQYYFQGNLTFERRWRTWLTPHEAKNLRRLLLRDEWINAFDDLRFIPGLWEGMMLSTLHTAMDIKCDEEILHYLRHIKKVWFHILWDDKDAMQKVDRATVVALQLRAPRSSTRDAAFLREKISGGKIFSAFNDHERNGILERVQRVKGLIPSLDDLFTNLHYLATLANCLKWLTSISRGETLTKGIQRIFFDADGIPHQSTVDTAGTTASATLAQQIAFGYRSLIVFAMKNYRRLPKKPSGKELLAKPIVEVDKTLLCEFANLARNLGFNSPEINEMQSFTGSANTETASVHIVPLLVADGPGVPKKNRSGMPHMQEYSDERQLLSLDHLHLNTEEVGEGITSFFVRKDIYLSFFGEWNPEETIETAQKRARLIPPATAQTQQQAHLWHQNTEPENLERERTARMEQFRLEQERLEQQMLERRRHLEGLEQRRSEEEQQILLREARLERLAKLEQERLARMEQERREEERLERERSAQLERGRLEQERLTQLERERLEWEKLEHEQLEQKRMEQERLEQERQRLVQLEEERVEQERTEKVRLAQLKQQRFEQEQLEQDQLEQKRLEQATSQQIQAGQEISLEEERMREEELRNQQYQLLEGDEQSPTLGFTNSHVLGVNASEKRNTQLDMKKFLGSSKADDTSRKKSNQEQSQSLNSASNSISVQPRESPDASGLAGPTPQPLTDLTSTSYLDPNTDAYQHEEIPVRFQMGELNSWTAVHECQQSRVERVAKNFIRDGNRLFDTELQPVLPSNCLSVVVANGTNTILVIPGAQISIDDALVESVEKIHTEALSRHKNANKRLAADNIAQFHHARKRQIL